MKSNREIKTELRPRTRMLAGFLGLAALVTGCGKPQETTAPAEPAPAPAAPAAAAAPAANKVTLADGVLRVCVFPNFQPFIGEKDQVWSGWDWEYLEKFAAQVGAKLEPVTSDFDGIWTRPGKGDCDIAAAGISDLPERRKEAGAEGTWSTHYYSVKRAFAIKKSDQLTRLEDLAGKKVIVTTNSTADLDIQHRISCANPEVAPPVEVVKTNDEGVAVEMVSKGGAFAYGGGLGSIELLVCGYDNLKVADWTHEQMVTDAKGTPPCSEGPEPFSFVVRTSATGLAAALDGFIQANPYPGSAGKRIVCPAKG